MFSVRYRTIVEILIVFSVRYRIRFMFSGENLVWFLLLHCEAFGILSSPTRD